MTVTDPLTAVPLEMRPLIEGVADRLQQDFSGIFSSETIQRYMAESWDQLSGAKVAAFVPLSSSGSAGSGSALARVGSSCSGSSVQDAQPSCPSRSAPTSLRRTSSRLDELREPGRHVREDASRDTFAGIAPASVPGFIAFQVVGAVIAFGAIQVLYPDVPRVASRVVVPHDEGEFQEASSEPG